MSETLANWNCLPQTEAAKEIAACCGSSAWAQGMAMRRPLADETALLAAADEVWRGLGEQDWMEAFRSHPRIGESRAVRPVAAKSAAWSGQEQSGLTQAAGADAIKVALADANQEYERRFGHIFIVCASGKSGSEMLEILLRRLHNDAAAELREAAEQQRQITHIRLKKWIAEVVDA